MEVLCNPLQSHSRFLPQSPCYFHLLRDGFLRPTNSRSVQPQHAVLRFRWGLANVAPVSTTAPVGQSIPRRAFVTTHWSVVLAARDPDSPESAEALEKLCGAYWYPLYAQS